MKIINNTENQKIKEMLKLFHSQLENQLEQQTALWQSVADTEKSARMEQMEQTKVYMEICEELYRSIEVPITDNPYLNDLSQLKKILDEINDITKKMVTTYKDESPSNYDTIQNLLCDSYEILEKYVPKQDYLTEQKNLFWNLSRQIENEYQEYLLTLLKYPSCIFHEHVQNELSLKCSIRNYIKNDSFLYYPCNCLNLLLQQPDSLNFLYQNYITLYQEILNEENQILSIEGERHSLSSCMGYF